MIIEKEINSKLNLPELKPKRKGLGTFAVPRKERGTELEALPAFWVASLMVTGHYWSAEYS